MQAASRRNEPHREHGTRCKSPAHDEGCERIIKKEIKIGKEFSVGGQSANNTGSAKVQRIYKIGKCV
jgi:hypothetical protein